MPLLAKSPTPHRPEGQTLLEHTYAVLARLREVAALRPDLPQRVGFPRLWDVLARAATVHDFGKAAQGFQAVLQGRARRWPYRHEVLSLAFVPWLAAGLTEDEATLLAAAVVTHHKDFPEVEAYLPESAPEDDPLADMVADLRPEDVEGLHRALGTLLPRWWQEMDWAALGVTVPPLLPWAQARETLRPQVIRAQLRQVATLLATWEDILYDAPDPLAEAARLRPGVLLRGYLVQSDHLGSAEVEPLPRPTWDGQALLRAANIPATALYAHQRQAAQTPGHALLIAPTGSGKTEAALLWAARQRPARLFYTLPYQASMNAMYGRLSRLFDTERVGLLHGRSTLALYRFLMAQEYTPDAATATARALRNKAGLAYYPVRVFSPYQMLKAAFQLKGYEALLADFTRAAFVFDEIHAYEPHRLAMILETVGYLVRHYEACFLFMSATFPRPIRERLQHLLGTEALIRADAALYRHFRRHRLHLAEGDLAAPEGLRRIREAIAAGQQVLVVVNTVRKAQELWAVLHPWAEEQGIEAHLLHSRFTGQDRLSKEQAILDAAGLNQTERRPLLVVATQVVEVSLNLDLDVLFTDPAPLEALLQRFGRVNRLGKRPPADVFVFQEMDDGTRRVYRPAVQVERTLEVLREAPAGLVVDEARIQDWLDAVYTGEVLTAWEEAYEQSAAEFRHNFFADLLPFRGNPALADQFHRLFDSVEVLPEGLMGTWEALRAEQPIAADALLVPIRWYQYQHLLARGLVLPPDKSADLPPVARVPYDGEKGMSLREDDAY